VRKNLSIIIATYNRAKILQRVLDGLLQQKGVPAEDYEILIVDNNSTDSTAELITLYGPQFKCVFRYLFQPEKGKSCALNMAVKGAHGVNLAFTDDDVILTDDWVKNIFQFVKDHQFDAAGGRVLPEYPENTPKWVVKNRDLLNGPIVVHDYGIDVKPYNKEMLPFLGANMLIKSKMFDDLGGFREDLGPGKMAGAEDTEFFRRMERSGRRILYCGNILIRHPVDPKRMSLGYLAKWNMDNGRYIALNGKGLMEKKIVCLAKIPRYLFRVMARRAFGLMASFKQGDFLENWCELFKVLGMMKEYRRYGRTGKKAGDG